MKPKLWLVGLFALMGSLHSEACGPFFQMMVTTCGRECLRWSPDAGPFAAALAKRFPGHWMYSAPGYFPELEAVTTAQLSISASPPNQRVALQHALLAMSAAESYRRSRGLPEAVRLYAAGAVAFRLSRHPVPASLAPGGLSPEANRAVAIQYFNRVIALPAAEAGPRRFWALYSIGRAWAETGGAGSSGRAEQAFLQVVREAPPSKEDPLQLQAAAMGALGGLAYTRNDLVTATRWYLEQAKHTTEYADVNSLAMVVEKALAGENTPQTVSLLVKRLQNPQLQQVIAAYVAGNELDHYAGYADYDQAWRERPSVLLSALRQIPGNKLQDPERFGLFAFSLQDYKLASQLLKNPKTSAGHWAAGKLALFAGNAALAAQHYAAVAEGSKKDDSDLGETDAFLAEQSLVHLIRGDYVEALAQLDRFTPPRAAVDAFEKALADSDYSRTPLTQDEIDFPRIRRPSYSYYEEPHFYRKDVAWVAERVMTTEELIHYVDKHKEASWLVRSILSRRLVREDRLDEAIRYAYRKSDAARIRRFKTARQTAMNTHLSLNARVRAALLAGHIEDREGMELRGAELYPDYAVFLGNYDLEDLMPSDLATADERKRVASSRVQPDIRFHYRKVAAKRLFAFSRALPSRSEELTVFLCEAAKVSREEPDDKKYPGASWYTEYQKRGRYFPEDRRFGTVCPKLHGVAISYDPPP